MKSRRRMIKGTVRSFDAECLRMSYARLGTYCLATLVIPTFPALADSIDLTQVGTAVDGFVINEELCFSPLNLRLGETIAMAGDVNGDGFSDIVMGAPIFFSGGFTPGRAYVIFGKTSPAPIELSDVANGTGGFVLRGEFVGQNVGWGVGGLGDVNGDGLADLGIAAKGANVHAGNVAYSYVVFGRKSTAPVDLSDVTAGTGGFAISTTLRMIACAGDINNDGLSDILADPRGGTFFLFGKTTGTQIPFTASSFPTSLGFAFNGGTSSVSLVGDANGDGLEDAVVGFVDGAWMGESQLGRAYLLFGQNPPVAFQWQDIGVTKPGQVHHGDQPDHRVGNSVSSAGDFDGDGYADFIVGASAALLEGTARRGRAYIVHGTAQNKVTYLDEAVAGTNGLVIDGSPQEQGLGRSVSAAGDWNGDGLCDVIIGVPNAAGTVKSDFERAYLVFGRTSTSPIQASAIASGSEGIAFVGPASRSLAETRVAGGADVNGDGLSDIVISASLDGNFPSFTGHGRAYVVFSNATPPAQATYRTKIRPGEAHRWGVGTHRLGRDGTVFVDSRCWIDFNGPGLLGQLDVQLNRAAGFVTGIASGIPAATTWRIDSTRPGVMSAQVFFRYTEADIALIDELTLSVHEAATPSGPWLPLETTRLPERNEIRATTTALNTPPASRYFALVGSPVARGDANKDSTIDVADVTTIYNLMSGIVAAPLPGRADVDGDDDIDGHDATLLIDHLVNHTALPQ